MASIKSQLALDDGVSRVLSKIVTGLNTTLSAFEQVQRASGQAFDTAPIEQARLALVGCESEIESITRECLKATEQGNRLNQSLQDTDGTMGGLLNKAKGLAASLGAAAAFNKLVDMSDQQTSTRARLSMMVDDGGSVTELENKIMASAQRSRAAYLDTAGAIASMGANAGSAFSGNDELIAFMEQVNKQFVIGGASAQGQSAAMLQLTQAMAAGALRGEELNSILENAPGIARAIEQYMGIAEGSIKQYAEEGKITAEVVKNALFSVADETNAKFESMPMTWAQVWTQMSNIALQVLQPVLSLINWLANNLSIIAPLVLAIGGAFLVFQVAAHWTQIAAAATAVYNGVVNFLSIGFGMLRGSTAAASAAQFVYNSALLACPVTWIIMAILLVIGLLYAVVAIVNKVAGTSVSATGIICGAFAVLGAFILNTAIGAINAVIQIIWTNFVEPFLGLVEFILNVCNGGFDSFGGAVANLIGNIISWFLSLGKVVTKIIDAIFGTNWTAGLSSLQDSVLSWGKNENAITLDRSAPTIEHRFEYGSAWDAGYDLGAGIEDKIGGMFNLGAAGDDYASSFNLDEITANTGDIANSAGGIADELEVSTEQLEYAAAWRATRAMGYKRLVTYILDTEDGTSLRAAGWKCIGQAGGLRWTGKRRPEVDLYPAQMKIRWEVDNGEAQEN